MVVTLSLVHTFPGGKPEQSVTSITLVNNTQKIQLVTVPTGKIWILLGIKVRNPDDVDRAVTIRKYKEAAKTNEIAVLFSVSLATGVAGHWPTEGLSSTASRPSSTKPAEIMIAGNSLEITWAAGGASAGGTDADGLVIEYLELDA